MKHTKICSVIEYTREEAEALGDLFKEVFSKGYYPTCFADLRYLEECEKDLDAFLDEAKRFFGISKFYSAFPNHHKIIHEHMS